jgi:hypothetical protein
MIILLSALLIVIARIVGGLLISPSSAAAILNAGVCADPCWHNIRPGTTTVDEAETILLAAPTSIIANVTRTKLDQFSNSDHELCWQILLKPAWQGCIAGPSVPTSDGPVSRIDLDLAWDFETPLTLGDAMGLYGVPKVGLLCSRLGFAYAEFHFGNDIEVRAINPRDRELMRLDPHMVIFSIRYYYPSEEPPYRFDAPLWQGFTSRTDQQGC